MANDVLDQAASEMSGPTSQYINNQPPQGGDILDQAANDLPKSSQAQPQVDNRGTLAKRLNPDNVGILDTIKKNFNYGVQNVKDFTNGLGTSVARIPMGAINTGSRIFGGKDVFSLPQGPESEAGQLGDTAGTALALETTGGANPQSGLLSRMAQSGLKTGSVTSLQNNGDVGSGVLGGVLGGISEGILSPELGGGIDSVIGKIQKMSGKITDPDSAAKAVVQGLRGSASKNRPDFIDNLSNHAMPLVKEAEGYTGVKNDSLDNTLSNTRAAKKTVWEQIEKEMGPNGLAPVNGDNLADAIEATATAKLKREANAGIPESQSQLKSIMDHAGVYRGKTLNVNDSEQLLKDTNSQLGGYYSKNPMARRIALGNNPDTSTNEALAASLRDNIYGSINDEAPGQGDRVRDLKKKYGALTDLENSLTDRRMVAIRQAPESLNEQEALAEMGRQAVDAGGHLLSGNPLGAGMSLLKGAAGRAESKWIREQQSTDGLLKRAFENYSKPSDVSYYTPPPPDRKLLGPATQGPVIIGSNGKPIITPAPQDSTPVSGPGMRQYPVGSGNNRLLGPATQTQQPGFAVTDAVPVRDPKTGKVTYVPKWMNQANENILQALKRRSSGQNEK